jgi:uncharacterized cupin superfamily protein
MGEANVYTPQWDAAIDMPPLVGRAARVGAHAGAERLGATLYEVAPGGVVSPYHVHHANEELIVVLDGAPTLRGPAGSRTLAPGDAVACPAGARGAHQVRNDGDAPVRVLIVSTMTFPEVAEHPDSGKVLVMSGLLGGTDGDDVVLAAFRRADAVPTMLDEVDDPAALEG